MRFTAHLVRLLQPAGCRLFLEFEPLHPAGHLLFCIRREEMADEHGPVSLLTVDALLSVRAAYSHLSGIRAYEVHGTEHGYSSVPVRPQERNKLVFIFPDFFEIEVLDYCLQRVMTEYIVESLFPQVSVNYYERYPVQIITVPGKLSRCKVKPWRDMISGYDQCSAVKKPFSTSFLTNFPISRSTYDIVSS